MANDTLFVREFEYLPLICPQLSKGCIIRVSSTISSGLCLIKHIQEYDRLKKPKLYVKQIEKASALR